MTINYKPRIVVGCASTSVAAGAWIEVTQLADGERAFIPGLSTRAKNTKHKCSHCGQYGSPESTCYFCGASVD